MAFDAGHDQSHTYGLSLLSTLETRRSFCPRIKTLCMFDYEPTTSVKSSILDRLWSAMMEAGRGHVRNCGRHHTAHIRSYRKIVEIKAAIKFDGYRFGQICRRMLTPQMVLSSHRDKRSRMLASPCSRSCGRRSDEIGKRHERSSTGR